MVEQDRYRLKPPGPVGQIGQQLDDPWVYFAVAQEPFAKMRTDDRETAFALKLLLMCRTQQFDELLHVIGKRAGEKSIDSRRIRGSIGNLGCDVPQINLIVREATYVAQVALRQI